MKMKPALHIAALPVAVCAIMPFAGNAAAQSDWEFQITPYVWMSGLDGKVGTIPGLPAASVDLSFGDILDNLDFAGMVFATARHDPWVLHLDANYVKTTTSKAVGGILIDNVKLTSQTTTLSMGVGYALATSDKGSFEAYLGARAWWLDNQFTLTTARAGNTFNRTETESWVDPLIGVSGYFDLSEKWRLFGLAEIGGFGAGAQIEWGAFAGVTYAINKNVGLNLAWRHQYVDYDSNGIVFNATQSGPAIGVTFGF